MENLENTQVQSEVAQANQEYIDAMAEVRQNFVAREKYEQSEKERLKLLDALKSGSQITAVDSAPQKTSDELRKEIWGPGVKIKSQCEYVEKLLNLRDAVMSESGEDSFVFNGAMVQGDAQAYENAEKAANIYRECLDYANGNDQLFISEVQRRMTDTPIANNIYNKNNKRR